MASSFRSLVGFHHRILAAALLRPAPPLPSSLFGMVSGGTMFTLAASVRQQPSPFSCSRATASARFFSSSTTACKARPAKSARFNKPPGAAAAPPQARSPAAAVHAQKRATAPPTTTAATTTATVTKTASAAAAAAAAGAVRRTTLLEQLGSRSAPTVLYAAPSHFWFRAAGLMTGSFFLLYTVGTFWTMNVDPRPGLAAWVPPAFMVICAVMAAVGFYFIASGRRLVRSIRAVPAAQLEAVAGGKRAAAVTGTQVTTVSTEKAAAAASETAPPVPKAATSPTAPTPVFLEIAIGRVLPLYPARKLYVLPSAVSLPSRLAQFGLGGGPRPAGGGAGAAEVSAAPSPRERVLARRAAKEQQRTARQYEMDHLMTAPFRHAWQGVQLAMQQAQRAMTRDGFLPLSVDGQRYRLDVTGGWALENGRALDRLVAIKGE